MDINYYQLDDAWVGPAIDTLYDQLALDAHQIHVHSYYIGEISTSVLVLNQLYHIRLIPNLSEGCRQLAPNENYDMSLKL